MAENVKMEDGVATQFKGQMQGAFDFLEDCSNSIENCRIVEELGFDNGSMKTFESSIKTTEESINGLLASVTSCENEIMQLDSQGTERVSEIFPVDEESHGDAQGEDSSNGESEDTKKSNKKNDTSTKSNDSDKQESSSSGSSDRSGSSSNSSDSSSSSNNSTTSSSDSSDSSSSTSTTSSSSTSTGDGSSSSSSTSISTDSSNSSSGSPSSSNDSTTSQDNSSKSYQFIYTKEEAQNYGDIFANEKYSLTNFTNYILDKYGIKDKNVAQKIYNSVIYYGNYYYKLNGSNPLNNVPEKEILSSIYNYIKYLIPNSSEDTFWSMLKDIKL